MSKDSSMFFYISMFTLYKPQGLLTVECYYLVLYENKKSQEVKFMELYRKDNGSPET